MTLPEALAGKHAYAFANGAATQLNL